MVKTRTLSVGERAAVRRGVQEPDEMRTAQGDRMRS